jgi:hypothetical protein
VAAGLAYWQAHAWRHAQGEEIGGEELEFGRRQFQRRLQTSLILGLLAIGLCVGQLIDRNRSPTVFVLFWLGMLLLLGWMVLLALGDLVLGRQHVARLTRERRIAEAQLNAELDRIREKLQQEGDRNGQHANQSQP